MKTIKTLAICLVATMALSLQTSTIFGQTAETDTETITLTANLNTTMALTLDATEVVFTFDNLTEYQTGIGANDEVSLTGDVASTADWKLEFKATSDLQHQTHSGSTIPLNQVGLRAELTGNYSSGNRIDNQADNTPIALSSSNNTIFDVGNGDTNAGTSADNEFELFWEMGTKNGNMKNKTLFEENYRRGQYQATVLFTLTEVI